MYFLGALCSFCCLYIYIYCFLLIKKKKKKIHDLNCSITFSHSPITFQDRSTRMTIGIGHESQGLYHLSSTPSSIVCTSIDEPLLIHRRLGHPNISKPQKIVTRFSSLSSLECESCQLGKHTRVSFPKHLESRTKYLFELVYTNVWGPSRTTSTLGSGILSHFSLY